MKKTKLKPYWDGLGISGRSELADRLGTTVNYLSQIARGHRQPSKVLLSAIAGEMGVPRESIVLPPSRSA